MPHIHWQKFLETTYKRGTDLIFVPGNPPLIRTRAQWQPLQLPPLTSDEVRSLASEVLDLATNSTSEGYTYCDFAYGSVAHFRAMAFGYPETTVLMVTRLRTPEEADFIKVDLAK